MIKYAYPLLYILLLFYCKPADMGTKQETVKVGETFTLRKGIPVKISGAGEALTLQLDAIADSRCPTNAICVWMGNATVSLSAANAQEAVGEIKMCIGDCRPEPTRSKHTMQVKVGNTTYNFTLKEVLPYPGSEDEGKEKMVKMEVEAL